MAKKQKKFCEILDELIRESKMTKVHFYTLLGIKKPYFYDIISGKVNPPPRERQLDMVKILKPSKEKTILLFNAAATERGEVPADIVQQLKDTKVLAKLRENIDYNKLLNIGDEQNG